MESEQIGRYRVIEQLGRGGFATVYLCEDRSLDDRVAVKLLAENHSADAESVARFVAEARVMRNLRTPGVVTVHDVGEHEGRPYFVMEFCDRGTLSERLESLGRTITVDEAIGLAEAINAAMGGLHSSTPPVVHRDIKPDNLLIRSSPGAQRKPVGGLLHADEELIVGDFGLAKVVDLQATKLSLIAYTRGFAPPEQVRGSATIQPSADVYSASAVIISAISGESPEQVFADGERAFSVEALATTGPLRPNLERGIRFSPEHRHNSVMEWSQALTDAGGSAAAPQESTMQVAPPPVGPAPHGPPQPASAPVAVPAGPANPAAPGTPTPSGLITPATVSGSTGPAGGSGGRSRVLLAVGAVAALAVVGIGALVATAAGGPSIIGPETTRVGEQAAFAVVDAEVERWEVGSSTTAEPVLLLMAEETGRVTVRAIVDGRELDMTVQIDDEAEGLRIVGPGHIPLGEMTVLSVVGTDGAAPTWVVGGERYRLETLEVRPTEPGVFKVEVETPDGVSVARTFTVTAG